MKRFSETKLEWDSYLNYLKEWAIEHKSEEFYGSNPACFDEWLDNEYEEEEEL